MTQNFKVGDKVVFGRTHGEQTCGTVVKVNPAKLKIRQDEMRGTQRIRPEGTIWTVPPSLCRMADASKQVSASALPAVSSFSVPVTPAFRIGQTVEFTAKGRKFVGTVKSINAKTISVDTPTGNWRVSPGLLSVSTAPVVPEAPKAKRSEGTVMREILACYSNLEPEMLTCDGEVRGAALARKAAGIRAKLKTLFAEMGRTVSEEEAWSKFGTYTPQNDRPLA